MKPANLFLIAVLFAGCASAAGTGTSSPQPPRDGTELLTRMHDAFAGKWYRTLTFVQKTTINKPGQPEQVQTWYESLLSPDRLRIDFGDPAEGNGVIYTADSVYVVRGGKQTRAVANGNPFLPFVAGVYTQPIATTLRQLAPYHFDLARIRTDTWQGRPVYVIGATSAADTTSPQFWVDRDRLVAVRMILALSPQPNAPPMDIHLDDYVEVGGGWLATRIAMLTNGAPAQTEQYSDWKANVQLAPEFFDAARWSSVPHWLVK